MSFISFKYYALLLLLMGLTAVFKDHDKKYFLIALANYGIAFLFGLKTLITLLLITVYSYLISKKVTENKKYLPLGIIPVVLILIVFKVLNLYKSIVAPIGLSFYGLQVIAYLVDISKDNTKYESDFVLYATAVSFFPALSSGPIEKTDKLIKRLKYDLSYDSIKAQRGVQLIAEGLFKKLVIANRIVEYADKVYANPGAFNGLSILIAIFLYSIQIYCDFSAYSEMAVGSANLLGIDLINNFDNPYFSKSVKEFWRRWHISLSSWLKEYVYIPLGGNKKGNVRKILNTILTFTVSGLWHGISLTYLIWGFIHGLLNSLPKIKKEGFVFDLINTLITFVLVSLSWVFFRANSVSLAISMFTGLFTRFSLSVASITQALLIFTGDINSIPYSLTSFIMIMILFVKEYLCVYKKHLYKENVYLFIIVICIILFATNGSGAFIYQGF